jgi:DNA-binding ferritin-like protein
MIKLATKLRYMQFYTHNAHNACKGETFYADHKKLGALYSVYEGLYDNIIERMLGLGQAVDLIKIQSEAVKMLEGETTPTAFNAAFSTILTCEEDLCKLIAEANEGASLGTQDLLQGMCNDAEIRQYKLKQRISKSSSTEAASETKEATAKSKTAVFKLLTSKK